MFLTLSFSKSQTDARTPTNDSYTQAESHDLEALQLFRRGNASDFQQALKKGRMEVNQKPGIFLTRNRVDLIRLKFGRNNSI
ncbi:hypothetical protein ACL6C3_06845 [Capilliphycus salinus ALCB114379]|uniref:hypothetical protein n=1 Tax=Capilliphycus salinus TaxID=2768948 RepID=UPI0039A767EC